MALCNKNLIDNKTNKYVVVPREELKNARAILSTKSELLHTETIRCLIIKAPAVMHLALYC